MRQAFIQKLVDLAKHDERIVLLTGDLGYMALEPFTDAFPERFFNCGVAEQNMVGVATGLAEAGFLPFVYSIVTFATLRCFEFIRNGPVAQGLPVRIVGVGGGVEYGHNGATHYGLEDVGALGLLDGLEIFCPLDAPHAAKALELTYGRSAPIYYRLGKDEKSRVNGEDLTFQVGGVTKLSEGKEALLLTLGALAVEGQQAVTELSRRDCVVAHWGIPSLAPFPVAQIEQALDTYPFIVTAEAHRPQGGLGSRVAEIAAERGSRCRVVRLGIEGFFEGRSGSQAYLYEEAGISPAAMTRAVLRERSKG